MAQIFLSHASYDAELAGHLKAEIESRLQRIAVFSSSDPTDLPPGIKWPKKVQMELEGCLTLIVLATSRSMSRPWVWFETGTVWFSETPKIFLCLGRVRKNALPSPFSELQSLNGDEPSDLKVLFQSLAQITGEAAHDSDLETLAQNLKLFDKKAEAGVAGALATWIGVEWNNRFLAYDGPIEGLQQIDDEVFVQAMSQALSDGGYRVHLGRPDRFSQHFEKGFRIVYLTDRSSWRRKIAQGKELVLLAKPIS